MKIAIEVYALAALTLWKYQDGHIAVGGGGETGRSLVLSKIEHRFLC